MSGVPRTLQPQLKRLLNRKIYGQGKDRDVAIREARAQLGL